MEDFRVLRRLYISWVQETSLEVWICQTLDYGKFGRLLAVKIFYELDHALSFAYSGG